MSDLQLLDQGSDAMENATSAPSLKAEVESASHTKQVIKHISTVNERSLLAITLRKVITRVQRQQAGHKVVVDLLPNHLPMGLSPMFQAAGPLLTNMLDEVQCKLAIRLTAIGEDTKRVVKSKQNVQDEADPNLRDRRSAMAKTLAEPLVTKYRLAKQLIDISLSNPVAEANLTSEMSELLKKLDYNTVPAPRVRVEFDASPNPKTASKLITTASGDVAARAVLTSTALHNIVEEVKADIPQLLAAGGCLRVDLPQATLEEDHTLFTNQRNQGGCLFIEAEAKDAFPSAHSTLFVRVQLSNQIDLYMGRSLGKKTHETLTRYVDVGWF